jgi:hypothetical protein
MIVERRMVEVMAGFGGWALSRGSSRQEKMLMGVVLAGESEGFHEGGDRRGEWRSGNHDGGRRYSVRKKGSDKDNQAQTELQTVIPRALASTREHKHKHKHRQEQDALFLARFVGDLLPLVFLGELEGSCGSPERKGGGLQTITPILSPSQLCCHQEGTWLPQRHEAHGVTAR